MDSQYPENQSTPQVNTINNLSQPHYTNTADEEVFIDDLPGYNAILYNHQTPANQVKPTTIIHVEELPSYEETINND